MLRHCMQRYSQQQHVCGCKGVVAPFHRFLVSKRSVRSCSLHRRPVRRSIHEASRLQQGIQNTEYSASFRHHLGRILTVDILRATSSLSNQRPQQGDGHLQHSFMIYIHRSTQNKHFFKSEHHLSAYCASPPLTEQTSSRLVVILFFQRKRKSSTCS